MIVKKCSPSTNLNYMDGREGSRAREAMGLLKVMRGTAKRLSRLPNAIAAENPEHALEVAVAEFLRCGSRRAFNLVKNLCDCRGVTGAAAVDVWRRIRDALASKGLRLVQCEPEAALLAAGTSMFSMSSPRLHAAATAVPKNWWRAVSGAYPTACCRPSSSGSFASNASTTAVRSGLRATGTSTTDGGR